MQIYIVKIRKYCCFYSVLFGNSFYLCNYQFTDCPLCSPSPLILQFAVILDQLFLAVLFKVPVLCQLLLKSKFICSSDFYPKYAYSDHFHWFIKWYRAVARGHNPNFFLQQQVFPIINCGPAKNSLPGKCFLGL